MQTVQRERAHPNRRAPHATPVITATRPTHIHVNVRLADATNSSSAALHDTTNDDLLHVRDQRNRILVLVERRRRTPYKRSVLDLAIPTQLNRRSSAPNTNTLRPAHINHSRQSLNAIAALHNHRTSQHRHAVAECRTTRAANLQSGCSQQSGQVATLDSCRVDHLGLSVSGRHRAGVGHLQLRAQAARSDVLSTHVKVVPGVQGKSATVNVDIRSSRHQFAGSRKNQVATQSKTGLLRVELQAVADQKVQAFCEHARLCCRREL